MFGLKNRKVFEIDFNQKTNTFIKFLTHCVICRIRQHIDGEFRISTVFCGANMEGQLFETMIFHKTIDTSYMTRCETHRQSLAMHKRARAYIKNKEYEYER